MFALSLDQRAEEVVARLSLAEVHWASSFEAMAKELAILAENYFKPMLAVRPNHTGATESSIRHEIHMSSDGFEITYYGLLSANYMDEGNFPPGAVLAADYYGYRAFPIDKRLGQPTFARTIHGMGARTPGVPTHWSEKTVEWLADGVAADLALRHVAEFLKAVG